MAEIRFIDVTTPIDRLVRLNNAHAVETSWLNPLEFSQLVLKARVALQMGDAEAFLLAVDQDAPYDNANFRWFQARYETFVYVDRIVVAEHARGRGYARQLYDALFARTGHKLIVCEVNSVPPNPASDALHAGLGFLPVGEATMNGGRKSVRYLARISTDNVGQSGPGRLV